MRSCRMDSRRFAVRRLLEFHAAQRCPPVVHGRAARREGTGFGGTIYFHDWHLPSGFGRRRQRARQAHRRCHNAGEFCERACSLQRCAQVRRCCHPPAWARALGESGFQVPWQKRLAGVNGNARIPRQHHGRFEPEHVLRWHATDYGIARRLCPAECRNQIGGTPGQLAPAFGVRRRSSGAARGEKYRRSEVRWYARNFEGHQFSRRRYFGYRQIRRQVESVRSTDHPVADDRGTWILLRKLLPIAGPLPRRQQRCLTADQRCGEAEHEAQTAFGQVNGKRCVGNRQGQFARARKECVCVDLTAWAQQHHIAGVTITREWQHHRPDSGTRCPNDSAASLLTATMFGINTKSEPCLRSGKR